MKFFLSLKGKTSHQKGTETALTICSMRQTFLKDVMYVILSFKDDFQSVLRSLRTLIFIFINGSLDGMRIDVIS